MITKGSMRQYWIILPSVQDIKMIEQTWTASQDIKDVDDDSSQRVLVSVGLKYCIDRDDGSLIRELTYVALFEAVVSKCVDIAELMQREDLRVSADEFELKLREG